MRLKTLRTFLWYLRKPRLYGQLWQELLTKGHGIFFSSARARKIGEQWCSQKAVSAEELFKKLGISIDSPGVKAEFPEVFSKAEKSAAHCPIKMGGAADLDILYRLAEAGEVKRALETGVAYGWSSLVLLLSIQKRGGRLVSTDMPYPGMENDPYVGCAVPEELKEFWTLLHGPDRKGIPIAIASLGGEIDLCHYDSDKSIRGRKWAYPRLWRALRNGGYFISDDIGDNTAFRDFAEAAGSEPIIVRSGNKYVGILVKQNG